ncbi:MAG: cupin domain-containing protein [Gaiellaceae bacterium]
MEVFNLFRGETAPFDGMPAGFHQREVALGELLGGSLLGMSVYDLEPGEKTWPYHYELREEEWLLVVAGEPTQREPEGERRVRPGDVVCFPAGPEGAHQLRNDTDEPVRLALLSTVEPGLSATVYPDSEKLGLGGPGVRMRMRIGPELDYWDGEA